MVPIVSIVSIVSIVPSPYKKNKTETMIQGIIFDYGGTLDTNGVHWAEVLWRQYEACALPVAKADFREAYVHGERTMGKQPLVQPTDDFHQVLLIKSRLQLQYLVDKGCLDAETYPTEMYARRLADGGYAVAKEVINNARKVLQKVEKKYKLVLVSNFYGNIRTILEDFGLLCHFEEVIESSVVGVRKPDPAIFSLGVEALGFPAGHVVVVGDSYTKDIVPAHSIGCHTVWLKGIGWADEQVDESLPDAIITDLAELPEVIEEINKE